MASRSITLVSAAALFCIAGCRTNGPRHTPAIGQAFVGPASLNIRRDISPQSPTVATVKHGDRVEILQQRRVFFRVRTPNGSEGWTTGSQLLSAADMEEMKRLTDRAAKMAAQGDATTYDDLRVHSQPSIYSPSFTMLKAKEKFAVLGHVVMPRTELPRPPLVPPAPKKTPPPKKESKTAKVPPPPLPKPPPLVQNWKEISKPELDADEVAAEKEQEEERAAPPAPEDDWSLIRSSTGQTGWVLTRRISMAIPDEVAQYAEGRRIVSYFSLGTIADAQEKKNVWLWTTIGSGHPRYDFDSFRVFIWSLKRHRYETAYIERNIEGYAPVRLEDIPYSITAKGEPGKFPGFSICLRKKDGSLVRRNYVLLTNIVRFAGESGCELPPPVYTPPQVSKRGVQPAAANPAPEPAAPEKKPGLMERLKTKLQGFLHHRR